MKFEKIQYKFIYEDEETGFAMYDYCTRCEKIIKQIDNGERVFVCEHCGYDNCIEIRNVFV